MIESVNCCSGLWFPFMFISGVKLVALTARQYDRSRGEKFFAPTSDLKPPGNYRFRFLKDPEGY
jgi:hypothetical protein